VGIVEEAREALRQGHDLAWTLPLVSTLGTDGRRLSILWIERCLRRLIPLARIDDRDAVSKAIVDLHQYEGHSPSQQEIFVISQNVQACSCKSMTLCPLR
jgi:hypothetical protein